MKNDDEDCLLWCLTANQHPAKHHPDRISNYNKPNYFDEIKLPNAPHCNLNRLKKYKIYLKKNNYLMFLIEIITEQFVLYYSIITIRKDVIFYTGLKIISYVNM